MLGIQFAVFVKVVGMQIWSVHKLYNYHVNEINAVHVLCLNFMMVVVSFFVIKSRNYVGSIAFAILFIILAICFNWWVCKQQVLSRVVDVYCLQKYVHYIFT